MVAKQNMYVANNMFLNNSFAEVKYYALDELKTTNIVYLSLKIFKIFL